MASSRNNLRSPSTQSRGCWFAISRCFNSKPVNNRSTAPIEFENLVTAEKRSRELRERNQVVTELEREHVMSGNFDQLMAEQEKLDKERDDELRRQEEALRMEEEAYHAAKRGASRKLTSQMLTDLSTATHRLPSSTTTSPDNQPLQQSGTQSQRNLQQSGIQSASRDTQSEEMGPWTGASEEPSSRTRSVTKDEEDFDKFLESVKAQQLSLSSKVPAPQPSLSDSEEEIDFGFWEKASNLQSPADRTHPTKELDLNLL